MNDIKAKLRLKQTNMNDIMLPQIVWVMSLGHHSSPKGAKIFLKKAKNARTTRAQLA